MVLRRKKKSGPSKPTSRRPERVEVGVLIIQAFNSILIIWAATLDDIKFGHQILILLVMYLSVVSRLRSELDYYSKLVSARYVFHISHQGIITDITCIKWYGIILKVQDQGFCEFKINPTKIIRLVTA